MAVPMLMDLDVYVRLPSGPSSAMVTYIHVTNKGDISLNDFIAVCVVYVYVSALIDCLLE